MTSNGGVQAFGQALFYGSDRGKLRHGESAIELAIDPATNGYWLLRSDGGVDGFGAATMGSLQRGIGWGGRSVAVIAGPPGP